MQPTTRKCKYCGNEFIAKDTRKIYCSVNCNSRMQVTRRKKKHYAPIKCTQCSKIFTPAKKNNRFCCVQCKDNYGNRHKKTYTKACKGCGKSFTTQTKKQKYCSVSCGAKNTKIVKTLVCKECKKEFEFVGRTNAHRCPECRKKYWAKYGNNYAIQRRIKQNPNTKIGVGSGGNQWGQANNQWKPISEHRSKKYRAHYRKRCYDVWSKECAVNSLHTESRIEIHHIDGNPDNFRPGNLIPLCRDCHWDCHRKRYKTPEEYVKATMKLLSKECRSKIAELSGEAETLTRTEGCSESSQGQSVGAEITRPRGRDTQSSG